LILAKAQRVPGVAFGTSKFTLRSFKIRVGGLTGLIGTTA
jgi:hypothetical protein